MNELPFANEQRVAGRLGGRPEDDGEGPRHQSEKEKIMEKINAMRAQINNFWARLHHEEDGMATAEYAIGTLAAAAFAGLLLMIMKGGELKDTLKALIEFALQV